MQKTIRDLDFDAIVAQIARATDPIRRIACNGELQADLSFVHSPADAVELLRDHVMLAGLRNAKTLADIRFEERGGEGCRTRTASFIGPSNPNGKGAAWGTRAGRGPKTF